MHEVIINIFKKEGEKLHLDVSKPFLANDDQFVWLIEKGSVNLSGTNVVSGEAVGRVQDFTTLRKGQAFYGIALKDYKSLCFLASPQEETILYKLPLDRLKAFAEADQESNKLMDLFMRDWIETLYRGIDQEGLTPEFDHIARAGWVGDVEPQHVLSTKHNVVWIEVSHRKALILNDLVELGESEEKMWMPISRYGFLRAREDFQVVAEKEEEFSITEDIWQDLIVFHQLVLSIELLLLNREAEAERDRLILKQQQEDEEMANMLEKATAILSYSDSESRIFEGAQTKSRFFNACQVVARFLDHELTLPPNLQNVKDPLDEISRFSSVRYRQILLEGNWYEKDGGPFLGFIEKGAIPVAILPHKSKSYIAYNPETKEKTKITEENAGSFLNYGFMLFKPLPNIIEGLKTLIKFSIPRDKSDYIWILAMSFTTTLLGMLSPILTAVLFDSIIPNALSSQLIYVGFGLGMAAAGSFLFNLTKSIALLRVESKMDQKVQAAVWDRLLNLPTTFFREFTAGDLAMRSLSVGQIRRLLSGVTISTVLATVFSTMNLLLLFYYSVSLAWVAILLVLIQVGINYIVGRMQVVRQKKMLSASGKTAGIVLQMLTGIAKFRVTGTEKRAFKHWMKHFLPVKEIGISLARVQNFQLIFNRNYGLLSMMVIFIMMIEMAGDSSMSIGEFLSFSAAYGIFSGAMMSMSSALITILQIGPLYDRTKPILEEEPENTTNKEAPSDLKGNIELNDIHFRYTEDGPPILNDLSLKINSGEFVALVGPSGSGKSTIIRLLLGFNEANTGAIYFDGQDLAHLDARLVRRKIGTVLQDGSLVSGDIFTNIVGASPTLTLDDAWDAARAAAFDKDIENMPMGMHTVVSESGGTISGGQRQRLMIARALVHRPKILIFDEATSALDNHTQKIVSDSLEQLHVTRIVVAHRLSTIQNADTIYYLEGGTVVEKGNFEELMEIKGKFYDLASRQLE